MCKQEKAIKIKELYCSSSGSTEVLRLTIPGIYPQEYIANYLINVCNKFGFKISTLESPVKYYILGHEDDYCWQFKLVFDIRYTADIPAMKRRSKFISLRKHFSELAESYKE